MVTPDRALAASLSYLLGLEPDVEAQDCSPREAPETIQGFRPDVILATPASRLDSVNGARLLPLSGLTPYELLLSEVRSAL